MAILILMTCQIKPDILLADLRILTKDKDVISDIQVTDPLRPCIFLLDNNLTQNNSYLLVCSFSLVNAESRIFVVGNNFVENSLVKCLLAVIFSYLEKRELEIFLIRAIKAVNSGEAWVSRQIMAKLIWTTVSG